MRLEAILAAMTAPLLCACSSETVGAPPAPPIDWHAFDARRVADGGRPAPTAKERAVAEAYAEALSSPGFHLLATRLDPEAHFAFPSLSDARGRDAVLRAHEVLFGAFEPRAVAMTRVWRTESSQALEWTLSGVQASPWLQAPATHRAVAIKGLTLLLTKDDGSITDLHVYFDVAAVKAQLAARADASLATPAAPDRRYAEPVAVSAPAPSEPVQVYEQTASPDEARQVAVARAWLDALENSQEAAYLSLVTDDVEVATIERPQPLRGKEELRGYFKAIHKAVGQLDTTVENAWGIAQFVVLEYSISGEQLGPIGGVAVQRDKVVRLHVADVLTMRDGRIARVSRYDDPSEILVSP
jgi:ketosteroid isomerase-like protein